MPPLIFTMTLFALAALAIVFWGFWWLLEKLLFAIYLIGILLVACAGLLSPALPLYATVGLYVFGVLNSALALLALREYRLGLRTDNHLAR